MTGPHENSDFVLFVTHVEADESYLKIWGQVDKNAATCVEQMILPLVEQFARGQGSSAPQCSNLTVNALCCARFQKEGYYRAKVLNIYANHTVLLKFIDYGNIEVIPIHEIHLLDNIPNSEALQSLPPVAHEFVLSNVLPINGVWDSKVIESIKKTLWYNEYKATLCSSLGNQHLIKLWFNNEDFADVLVKKHMAVGITSQTLLRSKYIQSTSMHMHQKPRSLPPNTNHINALRSEIRASQSQEEESHGIWKNVSQMKPTSTVYMWQPNSLPQHTPIHEALVFKSQVLDIGSKHSVRISYVEDGPQMFSVQTQSTSQLLNGLMRDINSHTTKPLQEPPLPGSVCLGRYTQDKTLCRAVVMSVMENKCKLYYVDFGHTEVLPYTDIFQLPPKYINPKVLSIRFTMSGIRELNITQDMKEYFKKIVLGKILTLHVTPPEGPPLIQYGDLYDNEHNIKDILKQAFSTPTLAPMELHSVVYPQPQLLQKGMQEIVHVSYVVSCRKFFIQLDSDLKCLESIMACVAKDASYAPVPKLSKLIVGLPCAASYKAQWYRAQILDINGDKIKISYVDYGNEEVVTITALRVIHEKLVTKLPAQAIKCSWNYCDALANNELISNHFESLILEKCLYMKVVDILPDGVLVDLYDPQKRESIETQLSRVLSLEKGMNAGSTLFFTPASDNLQSANLDEKKEQCYNENWQLESHDNILQESCKSNTWTDNIGDETYNSYETKNLQYDGDTNERIKTDNVWQDICMKQETLIKCGKNGANLRRKNDKEVRSCKSRFVVTDSKFNRSSCSPRGLSDKHPDINLRGSGRSGRMDSTNNNVKCNEVIGKVYGTKWNDKKYDKNSRKPSNKGFFMSGKQNPKDQKNHASIAAHKKENMIENYHYVLNDRLQTKDIIGDEKFQIPEINISIGSVKNCEVVFIKSPFEFFIQISPDYMELEYVMQCIETIYEDSNDIMPIKEIVPGAYCITQYADDLKWYRAKIRSIEETGATVEFVDYGNTELVTFEKIKTIQNEFLKLPAQAIPCKLFAVTDLDTKSFSDQVEGKTFEAEFVAKCGTIYDILLREVVNGLLNLNYLNEEFCSKAVLCKAKEELMGYKGTSITADTTYITDNSKWSTTSYEPSVMDDVIITWFINPNNFYCQACSKEADFRAMMKKIQKIYANRQPIKQSSKPGSPVVALFSDDGVLYRAEVLESNQCNEYMVQYVDFGNCAIVSGSNVYPVEKELMHLPKLAIHCTLKNIGPVESHWVKGNENEIDSCFFADKYECTFHNVENGKHTVTLCTNGQSVEDILVQKKLALYNNSVVTENAVPMQSSDYQILHLNLLRGQAFKVKISHVESDTSFIALYPQDIQVDHIDTINENSKNQVLKCRLQDADVSNATNEKLQSLVDGPEVIIYVEEIDCDRLVTSVYDALGRKLISNRTDGVCPICPMPVFIPDQKVSVSHAITSCNVWLQRLQDYEKSERLRQALANYYTDTSKIIENPSVNQLCAVRRSDGYWYRVKIVECLEVEAKVVFIDFGYTEEVPFSALMELDIKFYHPHQLAINAWLTMQPFDTNSEESNVLHSNLLGKLLNIKFSNVNNKWFVSLLESVETINDTQNSSLLANETKLNSSIEVFSDNIMTEGDTYDVHVSHADSPSQFWIQRIDETPILAENQAKLQESVPTYSNVEGVLEEGSLCAAIYSIDGMWYRAKVLDADEDITTVRFIDYGNTDIIDSRSNSIKYLPDFWIKLKEYSTKCKLNRVIPIDVEDWNEIACERFQNLVMSEKTLQAVPISNGKPMRVELFIHEKSVSEILVEERIAIMTHPNAELIDEIVDIELDPHSAFVSHVNSPSEFWVQEEKSVADLEKLTDRFIVADMFPKVHTPTKGLLCVAKYPEDESWYRARVVSHTENGTHVIYIDYGNSAISTDIRTIPEDLANILPLSRKCCLCLPDGIKEWSQDACEKFIDMAADGATIFLLDVVQEGETSLVKLTLQNESVTDILAAFCQPEILVNVAERLSPLGEESTADIVVSYVHTLDEFWVQTKHNLIQRNIILDRLNDAFNFPELINPKMGNLCVVKNPYTEQWERAKILSCGEHDVKVFYIDHGNIDCTNQLRILPDDLYDIPMQSKCCALQVPDYLNVWPDQAHNVFKQLAKDTTTFQCETLDNENPAHVRLKYNNEDISMILSSCPNEDSLQTIVNTGSKNTIAFKCSNNIPLLQSEERDVAHSKLSEENVHNAELNQQDDIYLPSKLSEYSENEHNADVASARESNIDNISDLVQYAVDGSLMNKSKENDLAVIASKQSMSSDTVKASRTLNQCTLKNTVTELRQCTCINMQCEKALNVICDHSDSHMHGTDTDICAKQLRFDNINSAMENVNIECSTQNSMNLITTDHKERHISVEDAELPKVSQTSDVLPFNVEGNQVTHDKTYV